MQLIFMIHSGAGNSYTTIYYFFFSNSGMLSSIKYYCILYAFIRVTITVHLYYTFILRDKMADLKMPRLDFGLEFERNGFEERFIFSEGSSNRLEDD